MIYDSRVFFDPIFRQPKITDTDAKVYISGTDCFGHNIGEIPLKDTHTLVAGTSGMGKTTAILNMAKQTTQTDAVHIFFDPKMDYYKQLYRPGIDFVLSLHDIPGVDPKVGWSIMRDASLSPHPLTFIREICELIFEESIKNSHAPFFPKAACIIVTLLWKMVYIRFRKNLPSNSDLLALTREVTYDRLRTEASRKNTKGKYIYPGALATIDRLIDPKVKDTTGGVWAELQAVIDETFVMYGNFCSNGTFSITNFVRYGKGKRLFIVHDFSSSKSSAVPCGILINLAAKVSLSISERNPDYRIYYYIDEMPVLPNNISLFQPLCSFGRSQGVRAVIGIQGEAQLEQTYGKETAAAILTCFTNNIILKTNDQLSIETLIQRSGKTHKAQTSMGLTRNSVTTSIVETTIIEPEILTSLDVGEAVVSILGHEPFWIKLDK